MSCPFKRGKTPPVHSIGNRKPDSILDAVLDTAVDAIITIDEDGTVQAFNKAAEGMFQYEAAEVLGRNVKMLMPEEHSQKHDSYLQNYKNTGNAKVIGVGREVTAKRKDGTIFPMELAVSELHIDGLRMFTGIIRDITDRKEAELEIESVTRRLHAILETAIDAIITIDSKGIIESYNNAAKNMLQFAEDEVLGQNISMLMPEEHASKHDYYIKHYMSTGDTHVIGKRREVQAKRKDGTLVPIELTVSEMIIDGEKKFTGMIRDITEREEAKAVAYYAKQLEKSNKELDAFAYVASHDLKSPLRAIANIVTWIKEDVADVLPLVAQEHLRLLQQRVVRMESLLSNLLEYSRVGRKKNKVSTVWVKQLIDNIEEMLNRPKDFAIICEDEMPVFDTEGVPLELVFRNLISNAIKHKEPDKEGWVRIGVKDLGDFYEFKVADNGPGIDKKYHKKIFEIFKTLKPRDEVEASGMGLAMVKKAVENHGGQIWLESSEGEGTTFYFTWKRITKNE